MYHLWKGEGKKNTDFQSCVPYIKTKSVENTHRDTTILFSLGFCYTFLHKTSYQAVVAAEKQKKRNHLTSADISPTILLHCIRTFSLQLDNMLIMLRQTDCTERAGDQSSVRIDKQMWPLLYTCGWTGIFSPVNITCTRNNSNELLATQFTEYERKTLNWEHF